MKQLYRIGCSIVLMAALGCSDDDSIPADAIVGEWIAVQLFIGEVERELSFCDQRIIGVYLADGRVAPRWTTGNEPPPECSYLNLSTGLTWENVGDNMWQVGNDFSIESRLRLEGNRLISEAESNDWVYVYERR